MSRGLLRRYIIKSPFITTRLYLVGYVLRVRIEYFFIERNKEIFYSNPQNSNPLIKGQTCCKQCTVVYFPDFSASIGSVDSQALCHLQLIQLFCLGLSWKNIITDRHANSNGESTFLSCLNSGHRQRAAQSACFTGEKMELASSNGTHGNSKITAAGFSMSHFCQNNVLCKLRSGRSWRDLSYIRA